MVLSYNLSRLFKSVMNRKNQRAGQMDDYQEELLEARASELDVAELLDDADEL